MKRGQLTDEIELLLKKIMKCENYKGHNPLRILRLLPYLDYILKNNGLTEDDKINLEELNILSSLVETRQISWDGDKVFIIEKEFYNLMNEILYLAYVRKERRGYEYIQLMEG